MSKFNVGDRVRVIKQATHNLPVGSVRGVVSTNEGEVVFDIDDCEDKASWYYDSEVELVEAAQPNPAAITQIDQAIEALYRAKEALQ